MNVVYNFLKNEIFPNNNYIIVIGNSSGPDSMALSNIIEELSKKKNIKIICAHVNHNLRRQSKEEEKFLEKYCLEKNIIFEHMTIKKYGDDNFHNEARKIRYNFFEEIVKKYKANYLMTAHHADDLMETILMRLTRGSSLKGYAGFSKIVDKGTYKLIRPLIYVTKKQIEEYDDNNNIKYYIDKSNLKTKYTRNRYRKAVLPFLKKEDPNVHEKFIKFSNLLLECDRYIDEEAAKIYKKICDNKILYINEYNKATPLLKYKVLCKYLENQYLDDLIIINDSHIKILENLINSDKKNSFINLPNNIVVYKEYDKLEIRKEKDIDNNYIIELNNYVKLPNGHIIEKISKIDSNDNSVCRLLKSEIKLPLYIRTRKDGDRIVLKKVNGSKKIKDVFIDSKIAISDRENWPIVIDSDGKIIWIPGIKKSKFTKTKTEKYDIILKYH